VQATYVKRGRELAGITGIYEDYGTKPATALLYTGKCRPSLSMFYVQSSARWRQSLDLWCLQVALMNVTQVDR